MTDDIGAMRGQCASGAVQEQMCMADGCCGRHAGVAERAMAVENGAASSCSNPTTGHKKQSSDGPQELNTPVARSSELVAWGTSCNCVHCTIILAWASGCARANTSARLHAE
jgi:hypothetical protein